MSLATVWNENILNSFLSLLGNVKVRASDNSMVAVPNISTAFPEEEFQSDTLPAISIQFNDLERATVNQMGFEPTNENIDTERGTLELTPQPVKYWIYYQVDFWSEYQEDIDNMLLTWLPVSPEKGGFLMVRNASGEDVPVGCSLQSMAVNDSVTDKIRLYRRTFRYRVSANIDLIPEVKPYITDVVVNISEGARNGSA